MFYKLSNIASRQDIERKFEVTFEYSRLYTPSPIINGLEESNLPIITMSHPNTVKIGIWGMLPQDFEDNWKVYQNLSNTLNINVEHIDFSNPLYSEALDARRCTIIVTGFFTSVLYDGMMFPHYVHLKNHQPFGIAGLYNQLDDGFITCSILIDKTDQKGSYIPNMLKYSPLVFDLDDQKHWLDKSINFETLRELIFSHQPLDYLSHPVPKEFFDNNIIFNDMLHDNVLDKFLKIT